MNMNSLDLFSVRALTRTLDIKTIPTILFFMTRAESSRATDSSMIGPDLVAWDEWQGQSSAYSGDDYGEENWRLYEFRTGSGFGLQPGNTDRVRAIQFSAEACVYGANTFHVKFSREDFTEADFQEMGTDFSEVTGLMTMTMAYP